jgi:uncharacterized protein involved in exopolysaccharide biosynthesis
MDEHSPVTILDYWRIVWRARWAILILGVVGGLAGYGFAIMQPKVYTARATILAPKESTPQSLTASIGAMLSAGGGGREGGGVNIPGISMPSASTNQDMFMAVLKSSTLRQRVVEEFRKTWGANVGVMIKAVDPSLRDKGIVALTVEATDPKLAASLANEYFNHLDRMLESYAEQATKRQEAQYAQQLDRAAREVQNAEQAVLKFQAENRIVISDTPQKGGAAVDAGAGLRGTIMALEMQREVMRMKLTDQHPQMREIEKQIVEMKKQYSKNLFGAPMDLPGEGGRHHKEFFVATEKMTPVQFAYLKLYRNLKIQEAFYTGALQGLEQIKYTDLHSQPRVEFLDPATPPGRPSRPDVRTITVAGAVSALAFGALLALVLEYFRRLRADEQRRTPATATVSTRARPARPAASPLDDLEPVESGPIGGSPPQPSWRG